MTSTDASYRPRQLWTMGTRMGEYLVLTSSVTTSNRNFSFLVFYYRTQRKQDTRHKISNESVEVIHCRCKDGRFLVRVIREMRENFKP